MVLAAENTQVTWLVVTEAWSETFRLVKECHHYHGPSTVTKTDVMSQVPSLQCMSYAYSSSSVVSRTFSALCVYSKFGHHSPPIGYFCDKFCFFRGLHCWASPCRTVTYSINHSISHWPRLFDAPGTKLLLWKRNKITHAPEEQILTSTEPIQDSSKQECCSKQ